MSRLPRLRSFLYRGRYRYSLTMCTYRRVTYFQNSTTVGRTFAEFLRLSKARELEILAYCFMPDHLHMLVESRGDEFHLRDFVKLAKQRSGYLHRQTSGQLLWQEGYHERVLRELDDPRRVARYILENPVRAGLVADVRDYSFVGSAVWSVEEILGSL